MDKKNGATITHNHIQINTLRNTSFVFHIKFYGYAINVSRFFKMKMQSYQAFPFG